MQNSALRVSLAILFALTLFGAATASAEGAAAELGAGLVISPDYGSMLEDVYDGVGTGIGGWVNLQGGIRLPVNDQFSITPTLGLLLNYVIVTGAGRDETYLNSIVVPSVAARYAFTKAPSFYVGGEVNYNLPNTGSDYYELNSGGVGFAGFFGYAFEKYVHVEIGYLDLPVEVDTGTETSNKNMGGGIIRLGVDF